MYKAKKQQSLLLLGRHSVDTLDGHSAALGGIGGVYDFKWDSPNMRICTPFKCPFKILLRQLSCSFKDYYLSRSLNHVPDKQP